VLTADEMVEEEQNTARALTLKTLALLWFVAPFRIAVYIMVT